MIGRAKDPNRLSRNPEQIRRRLRRRHEKFSEDLEMYIEVGGIKPVEEWDIEELARGRPRNKSGGWQGKTPSWISADVTREAKRRLMDEAFGSLAGHLSDAVRTVHKLMMSEEVDDKGRPIVDAATQLKAAMFIIENIVGKPKAIIEMHAEDLTKQMIASAIVLDDGNPQDELVILEGEIVEDEEEEDDDEE